MKQYILATEIPRAFHMDRIPKDPNAVPSMDQMREAYGAQLPANDMVHTYLPLGIRVT